MIPLFLIDGFVLILPHTLACIPHLHLLLHTFHITFTLCMHSNFSCLCSHSLYFSFLHFTLVRCMIQSLPIADSTWSPNPSLTAFGFVADRFRACYLVPVLVCLPAGSRFRFVTNLFSILLSTNFRFCYRPVSSFATSQFPVLLANQFQFPTDFNSNLLASSSLLFISVPITSQAILGT